MTILSELADRVARQVKNFTFNQTMIQQELSGIFGSETMRDMKEILALYNIYEEGAPFNQDSTSGDYVPAFHKFKIIRAIIDKEARFLFSQPPKITLIDTDTENKDKERLGSNQKLIESVLEANHFNSKLVRAARDCLVGRRIAIAVDFNEDKGIDISFMPSLEFIYETDPSDIDIITKFIRFYNVVENNDKAKQRVYKKKWELNEQGRCVITEGFYDGSGKLVSEEQEFITEFNYIPCWVIINGGMIGDPFGKSDVEDILEDESWYSKLSSKDFDSLRKGTDQIVWAMDVSKDSTANLPRSAGAFWDLSSDPSSPSDKEGKVGVLDNSMAYAPALETTLNRIRANMYSQLDVPDTTSEALTGIVTSGKTMKAIYWGLMVRCDEKLLDWVPALQNMVYCIIEGCRLYPNAKRVYTDQELVDGFIVKIENTYPILEDESEEKSTDMAEVATQVMSRKSYMKKWRNLSDDDVDAELKQIAYENTMLDQDNYVYDGGMTNGEEGE